jgi:phage terminase large subunit GpA-like protein
MDCLGATSRVRRVVMMFGSQLGKTEAGLNWLGYVIHSRPAPTLLVQPTLDMAKRLSKQRLEPFIAETPVLAERIAPARSRDSGNTMFLKEFTGGMFVLTGANSASSLQSMPAANLFADEVSSFPLEADDKGDPLENAEARTTNFPRGKVLITSTPGELGSCRVTEEFLRSDQRHFFVPCPCCGGFQVLRWPQFKWADPEGPVLYECEHCNQQFEELHKTAMLAAGEWRATAKGDGETAGFHLPGWYSPLGWLSWRQIRDQFLRAKNDALLLKGWVNKRSAEAWEDEYRNKVSADGLAARREEYAVGTVPDGALVLTAGVDVQGGAGSRIAVTIWGWGRGEEAWHIWTQEIWGDTTQPEVWLQLDAVLESKWSRGDGREMAVTQMAVDSGYNAHEVYSYCRERRDRGVIAIKGASTRGKPVIGKGAPVDINRRNQTIPRGCMLYIVGVDTVKTTLMGRLRNETKGPGYIHLGSAADDEFLRQFTGEKQKQRTVKGRTLYEWQPERGVRVEGLDCSVYAYAALHHLAKRYNRQTMWDQLEAQATSFQVSAPAAGITRKRGTWLR